MQVPQPRTIPDSHHYPDPQHFKNLSRLGDEITELSAHLYAGTCQLLELIRVFDEEGGWHGTGIASCAHWLNWKCGTSLGAAREQVRVARALPELPKILAAFRQGRVSYSKVRAMTRVATARNEDVLLNVALHGTAAHVETQVRLYRKVKRIEALKQDNLHHEHRELNLRQDDDGFWVLRARFTPDQGALVSKALEAAQDELFEESEAPSEVPPTAEPITARRADALVRMSENFLAGMKNDASGGDRYMVHIHIQQNALMSGGNGAESKLEDRGHVSAETSRRMACDCSVVHWHEDDQGEPLNIGRKSRTIPPAIRRALKRRDGGCRFPGCSCTRFVDAHHIRHWADGGETSMDNLVLLCRRHHRLVHEGGFDVHTQPSGQIRFTRPDGTTIPAGPDRRFRGNVVTLKVRNRQNDLDINPLTPVPKWRGEIMDNQLAVLGLIQRE